MKLIIVDKMSGRHRSFSLGFLVCGLALTGLVCVPIIAGFFAYRLGMGDTALTGELVAKWREVLADQRADVENARWDAEHHLGDAALRIAQLQARIIRLDALAERLARAGRLDEKEFAFSQSPAMGGPENPADVAGYQPPTYMALLDQLARDIEDREQQLEILETLVVNEKMQWDAFLAGRPVRKGWISSRFGYRNDPITGKRAWHNGIDFAGKAGSDVLAVATGVVTFAGYRNGYGQMIELYHGGGYSTRYGHHKALTVKTGDIVRKGEVVGLMGSTGRTTGPHVHFEVFKNGRIVDPAAYIHRTSR